MIYVTLLNVKYTNMNKYIKVNNQDWIELWNQHNTLSNTNKEQEHLICFLKDICGSVNTIVTGSNPKKDTTDTAYSSTIPIVQNFYNNYLTLLKENEHLKEKIKTLQEDFPE